MSFVSPSQLDFNNPGTWPFVYKVVLWVVMVAIILGFAYKAKFEGMHQQEDANKKTIEDKLKTYQTNYRYQIALDQYLARKKELIAILHDHLELLPDKNRVAKLIDDVYASGTDSDISFREYKPANYVKSGDFDIAPVSLKTTTYFTNFSQFAQKLVELEQIMNIADFSMSVVDTSKNDMFGDNAVAVDGTLRTYMYDPDVIKALMEGEMPPARKK
ncbi:MAG: type 4a pilus biogenesis protein PilO [Cardiobacteriaceae bacterium]|nr:type 4a pilus biogenesis protein PilO [Cardiobacteriaceae bacterium]